MKKIILACLVLYATFILHNSISGDAVKETNQNDKIQSLIIQLGDNDWETREAAQLALLDHAENLFRQYRELKKALRMEKNAATEQNLALLKEEIRKFIRIIQDERRNSDPEVVMRAKLILRRLIALAQPQLLCVDINSGPQIFIMDADGQNRRKITEDALPKEHPACNWDGSKIAFSGGPEGDRDIYVADFAWEPEGWVVKNQVKLTSKSRDNIHPTWSPDGRRIAFASNRNGRYEIYLIDEDGHNQKQLTNSSGGYDDFPSWTPDGQKITFTTRQAGSQVLEIDTIGLDGRNQTRLLDGQCSDWASDGNRLAFISSGNMGYDIFVMSVADNKTYKQLTNNAIAMGTRLSWSPDSTNIAFATLRNKHFAIGVVDSSGKEIEVITSTDNANFNTSPAWKPTGLEEFIVLLSEALKK
ncbi:MAG: PD40 domain-containing protein [Planctomycetes bacterium]|nr:PD40 domain-containing protein [Planctomycetota bacterium]